MNSPKLLVKTAMALVLGGQVPLPELRKRIFPMHQLRVGTVASDWAGFLSGDTTVKVGSGTAPPCTEMLHSTS